MGGEQDTTKGRVGATAVDPDDSLLIELEEDRPPEVSAAPHLHLEQPLGRGAMGEVWLARDDRLARKVALKLLGARLAHDERARQRFVDEARATAQLAHPGIVPVHEIGTWSDGRPYYTMEVIRGETFGRRIEAHHAGGALPDELHHLVDHLRRACEAVGYAHARGVVHRDLKPDNLLIGDFGQVLVVDWGLVRADPDAHEPVRTDRPPDLTHGPAGTPRYMSPEQVLGLPIGPRSDVFSLGAILVLLLEGRPAFPQDSLPGVLDAVAGGRAALPTRGPEALRSIAEKALARAPEDRYADGGALAEALGAHLAGERRRARALIEVREAWALESRIAELREQAAEQRALAARALDGVAAWMPLDRKIEGWRHEDEAERLSRAADELLERRIDHAEAALSHEAELPEALALLADHHAARLRDAEARRDALAAQIAVRRLRRFDRGRHARTLEGLAAITLVTDPPGATVIASRVEVRDRRRVAVEPRVLGTTPLHEVTLPHGDWELRLEAAGRVPATVPVSLARGDHADFVRPGESDPWPIRLLRPEELGPDDCYVPAGACWLGAIGLDFTTEPLRRQWVDGYVIRRFPVTNAEYLAFLDGLVRAGEEERALELVPRERGSGPAERGVPCYGRREDGGFCLVPDADGDRWDERWPVMMVDWHSAVAYAEALADQTGLPWRLPTTAEWEKAGRGADGRLLPWGDHADPAFMCVRESHPRRPLPATIDAFPEDRSVYGVRGLAGNVRDWCADAAGSAGEQRALRGGCWFFPTKAAMLPLLYAIEPHRRGDTIGFRLVRSLR